MEVRHQHGGGNALARRVAEDEEQATAVRAAGDHVAVVTAYRAQRLVVIGYLPAVMFQALLGQQVPLHLGRKLQVLLQRSLLLS